MMDNKQYKFKTLEGCSAVIMQLSGDAVRWLNETTRRNDGNSVCNGILLNDLLSRMQLSPDLGKGFRRPQQLREGQAQYSEIQLQAEWNIGRKVIRRLLYEMESLGLVALYRSTVASVATFPFVIGWSIEGNGFTNNPFMIIRNHTTSKA